LVEYLFDPPLNRLPKGLRPCEQFFASAKGFGLPQDHLLRLGGHFGCGFHGCLSVLL
jgi:hypothetical protein